MRSQPRTGHRTARAGCCYLPRVTQIPPGWHPDPAGQVPGRPPLLRWWDGTAWTEHVAPAQPPAQPFGPAFGEPYAARPRPVPTTPDGQPLAGWWWRVLAYVMDAILVGIVANLVSLPVQIDMRRDLNRLSDDFQRRVDADPSNPQIGAFVDGLGDILRDHALGMFLPALLVVVVYHCAMLRWKGATVGKLAVGLRVRRREAPGTLPWSAIAIRVMVQFVIVNLLTLIGFAAGAVGVLVVIGLVAALFQLADQLWPLWDRKRQALHDKAAGTNVVSIR
jgi:uncharacterized RDD family membrane protein YckC